jgi:hypothetical protein
MSGASIAPIVADSMSVAASSAAAQPTAQQAARFEQQLQQVSPTTEPAYYGVPVAGVGSDFHAVVDYVGEASTRLSANLEPAATQIDLQDLPPELQQQLRLQQELNEGMRNMSNATLEFELIGKSVELAENMPKVLYQQG